MKGINFGLFNLIELFNDTDFKLLFLLKLSCIDLLSGVLALLRGKLLLDIKSPSILICLLLFVFFFNKLLLDLVFLTLLYFLNGVMSLFCLKPKIFWLLFCLKILVLYLNF